MRIALAVTAGLFLLFVLLLSSPLTAYVEYNGAFAVKVKYLFFTFFPVKEKKRKNKPEKPEKKRNNKSLSLENLTQVLNSAKEPVKKLIRKTRVTNLRIKFIIGGDDAAATAINYGLQSALVSGLLAWLDEAVILEVKEVSIKADFTREETERRFKCRVKIRVFTALVCLFGYIGAAAKAKQS